MVSSAAKTVAQVIRDRPAWVDRQIDSREVAIISNLIRAKGFTSAAEIGVASGFSSAIIYAALAANTGSPRLHAFDLSADCYYDRSRRTGQAFYEIHGEQSGYALTLGAGSDAITAFEPVDFIFIDANHAGPWPALDVLSLGRYLKPGGCIGLDDIEMIFHKGWLGKNRNGARDLFRSWRGPKVRYEGAAGLAILSDVTEEILLKSVANALRIDWDQRVADDTLERFHEIAKSYGPMGVSVSKLMARHRKTWRSWKPIPADAEMIAIPGA